jgi:hypothetical protein
MNMLRRIRARFKATALMALVVLLLGALAHFEHHLLDPGCDPTRAGETHACSCAAFHAGALAESIVASAPRVLTQWIDRLPSDTSAPAPAERGVCATRGPPSA